MPVPPPPSRWDLPDPGWAEPGADLIAIGADLDPSTVFAAYQRGLFPMHVSERELGWWSPDPRGVLPLDGLRVTRSLARSMRRFTYSIDRCFTRVMRECGDERRDSGWITEEFVDTYTRLHELGWAHSVEVWDGDVLAGGLYGVEVGGLFAAESKFSRATDASKVAVVALADLLAADGRPDRLIDVQWRTDHLARLGVVEVPRGDYLRLAGRACTLPAVLSGAAGRHAGGDAPSRIRWRIA